MLNRFFPLNFRAISGCGPAARTGGLMSMIGFWSRLRSLLGRRAAAVCFVLSLIVVVAVPTFAAGGVAHAPDYKFAGDPQFEQTGREAVERYERDRADRQKPERQRERLDSRHAYGNASHDRALAIAKVRFKRDLLDPVWTDVPVQAGEHLSLHGRHGGIVSDANGRQAAVESNVPLQAADDHGHLAPIDLSLEEHPDGLSPKNPITPITISNDANEGARLDDNDVRLAPAAVADRTGETVADKVFFANTEQDTDLWVAPDPGGFEAFAQLRSENSPERLHYRLGLPEGATVGKPDENTGMITVVDKDGRGIAVVGAARAEDSDGESVPARFEVDGSTITMVVEHRGGDFLYPIVADPSVIEYDYWQDSGTGIGQRGWVANSARFATAFAAGWAGTGLYVSAAGGQNYNNGEWGAWDLTPFRAGLTIPRAEFQTGANAAYTCTYMGIWPTAAGAAYDSHCAQGYNGTWDVACEVASCDWAAGRAGSWASFGLQMLGTGYRPDLAYSVLMRTAIFYWDLRGPDYYLAQFVPYDQPWSQFPIVPVSGIAHDNDGIGMRNPAQGPAVTRTMGSFTDGVANGVNCDGTRFSPCATTTTFNFDAKSTNQGITPISVTAYDYVGNQRSMPIGNLRTDNSVPTVTPSGPLFAASGQRIDDDDYALHVDATDAGTTYPKAGVAKVQVRVDGTPVATVTGSCMQDCGRSLDWTFHSGQYGAGDHQVQAVATDQAGNVGYRTWTVKVAHSASQQIGPGAVNLATGNFSLDTSDIDLDANGSGLALSRTYNSRDLTAGTNGAFGPQWAASLPVDGPTSDYVSLVEATDPDDGTTIVERVTTSDGDEISFKPSGGNYTSPPGYDDLTLTKPSSGRFELKDLDGNVTVFTLPSGTSTYVPTELRTPGSGTKVTLAYEVANGAPRVTRVTAPTPAGITGDCATSLVRGCRALTFAYAATTTATGTTPGAYVGRVDHIDFTAWDPSSLAMTTTRVASYEYDTAGSLVGAWDPRVSPVLKEKYAYDSVGHLTQFTPAGTDQWTMSYASIAGDPNTGRLKSASRAALPGTSTTTVAYTVPVSGAGAPYPMAATNIATWGQTDAPVAATAIFPPDQVPATPPTSYSRATVYYLDAAGRQVNVAEPGGRISTHEFDSHDNVIRTLTAANRAAALSSGTPAARAVEIDTQRTYNSAGTMLVDTLGPMHTVRLANGDTVDARQHLHVTYDEGAPAGVSGLPTTATAGAQVAGQSSDSDARVKKSRYDGQSGLGWTLRLPTSNTVDPTGLNLTTTTLYDPVTGQIAETRLPGGPNGGDAHTKRVTYYAATTSVDPACANRPEWAGLACKVGPAAQPGGTLPNLPTTTYTYTRLNDIATQTDTNGTASNTSTFDYDASGREITRTNTSTESTAVAPTSTTYSPANGQMATTSRTEAGVTRTISRQYDTLGRVTSYTDADGTTSTSTFDPLGRPKTINDGKGTQTLSYDPLTGYLTGLSDTAAGSFSATYDASGNLLTQTLPNGLQQQKTYDEAGQIIRVAYVKLGCVGETDTCTWVETSGVRSAHDQFIHLGGTSGQQDYSYDNAGRLTQGRNITGAGSCKVNDYSYDSDSNRLSQRTHAPGFGGACDPSSTGTLVSHTYDASDRLTDAGTTYDNFGRTLSLSGPNAGGGALTNSYYSDGLIRTASQGGVTRTYSRDASGRQRSIGTTGGDGQTHTIHYSDDSDSPSWETRLTDGSAWTRNVEGIDGELVAIQDSATGVKLQLGNLHDDVVAEASLDPAAAGPTKVLHASDEFGVPTGAANETYGWLGSKRRRTTLASGIVDMGVRQYVPALGRFAQVDPVVGGSANDYDYAYQDPVNGRDLDGRCGILCDINALDDCPEIKGRAVAAAGSNPFCVGEIKTQRQARRAVNRIVLYIVTHAAGFLRDHRIRVAIHPPHHREGNHYQRHIQINIWKPGVKGSGRPPIRIYFGRKYRQGHPNWFQFGCSIGGGKRPECGRHESPG